MAWYIIRQAMSVHSVPTNSIDTPDQIIFNDMSESTTSIKIKTTLSSDKFSHSGPLAAHEVDGGG